MMISQGFLIATDYLAIAISSVAILGVCHDDEHDDDDDHDNLCRFFHFSRYLKNNVPSLLQPLPYATPQGSCKLKL